ncbi:serine/threonine protein kinase [Planctobacterium marinum]|uniref:Protein kinase domain-containing protein n=1 Tax=Planctobacterium marinum TaxID=1631968 RepID=A0AA48HMS6_9ALTE|nr:hypothetical protein MACH26_19030 [Planctobacterium marinum]
MEQIGKYKVIKLLGQGGFGAVYLAEAPITNAQVAIKVFQVKDDNLAGIATSASQDASTVLKERFLSEARTLEKLSHNPYIVSIRDYDELDDGTPYYVMPYLPTSLEQEIGKDAFTRGKLEETPKELHPRKLASARALEILKQILEGMSAVHEAGLIHRDIKPANVLFDAQGNVQICDFGIAKLPDAEFSQSGVGMGSRNYMSPEQRESAKHVSEASDVYSIGVLAYRMLTGQLPVGRFQDAIHFAPEIGEQMNDLLNQAISQQERKRPKDAGAFLLQLNQALKFTGKAIDEEDGSTGTWVGGEADIKAELKPLKTKIEQVLLNTGEIPDSERFAIEAMAAVFGISGDELSRFISIIEQQLESDLTPLRNWLAFVDVQAKKHRGSLDEQAISALLMAGQTLTKKEETLREHISSACARHKDDRVKLPQNNKKSPVANQTQTKPVKQPATEKQISTNSQFKSSQRPTFSSSNKTTVSKKSTAPRVPIQSKVSEKEKQKAYAYAVKQSSSNDFLTLLKLLFGGAWIIFIIVVFVEKIL